MKYILVFLVITLASCANYRDWRYARASNKFDKQLVKVQFWVVAHPTKKKKATRKVKRLTVRATKIDNMPHTKRTFLGIDLEQ